MATIEVWSVGPGEVYARRSGGLWQKYEGEEEAAEGEAAPWTGECLCGGKRGWFQGKHGDMYCSCPAGHMMRAADLGTTDPPSRS